MYTQNLYYGKEHKIKNFLTLRHMMKKSIVNNVAVNGTNCSYKHASHRKKEIGKKLINI